MNKEIIDYFDGNEEVKMSIMTGLVFVGERNIIADILIIEKWIENENG